MRIPELSPNGKDNKFVFIGLRKEKRKTAIKDKQYMASSTILWQNREHAQPWRLTRPSLLEHIFTKNFLPTAYCLFKFSMVTNFKLLETYSLTLKDEDGYAGKYTFWSQILAICWKEPNGKQESTGGKEQSEKQSKFSLRWFYPSTVSRSHAPHPVPIAMAFSSSRCLSPEVIRDTLE